MQNEQFRFFDPGSCCLIVAEFQAILVFPRFSISTHVLLFASLTDHLSLFQNRNNLYLLQ